MSEHLCRFHFSFTAMASPCELQLYAASAAEAVKLVASALDALGAPCDAAFVRRVQPATCPAPTKRKKTSAAAAIFGFEPQSSALREAEAKAMAPPESM